MTNWPNLQEYRNLKPKFIDDPKLNIDSAADNNLETVITNESNVNDNAYEFTNNEKLQNSDSKTVRCVIRKDFEETFKLDRENGIVNHEFVRPKPQEKAAVDRSFIDQVRLQNHLKWKKQKEEEYLQKKEGERLAQKKKREEDLRLEKAKKQKEKEKEERIREWQEQKAREKEEKKKEKMVMKMLEKKLKVTPSVDKEKLIEEWVKLKNKQKQMEAEKKVKLLKKEEENRALRQNLAELSYRQWKERIKGRMMTLPKNGYQIFGPKPVPVVKEDWNHDFIIGSPRNQNNTLRGTKSNITTSLTFRPAMKELESLSKDIFYLEGLKSRSPSFYNLNITKSELNLYKNCEAYFKGQCEMPLKELQQGTIDLKKKGTKSVQGGFVEERTPQDQSKRSEMSFLAKLPEEHPETYLDDFMCLQVQGDQSRFVGDKKSEFLDSFLGSRILPNKKKIDLYINTCPGSDEYNSLMESPKKTQPVKGNKSRRHILRKDMAEKRAENDSTATSRKQKCCVTNRMRSVSLHEDGKQAEKMTKIVGRKPAETETAKACRRSLSYDKSAKKVSSSEQKIKTCSLSKSMVKVTEPVGEESKSLKSAKSRTCCKQKRSRSRKPGTPEAPTKSEKKISEQDHKTKKKLKKKNSLAKSFSFSDSPYCIKNTSKSPGKGRKLSLNDVET